MPRRVWAGLCAGALGGLLSVAASRTTFGAGVEAQTFDWRVARHRSAPSPGIVIVEINESSVRALAPVAGRWPWPRAIHAGVIDYLSRSRARAIVYDVQFTEADTFGQYRLGDRTLSGAESDAELVASVRRAGNVILLADVLFEGLADASHLPPSPASAEFPGVRYSPGGSLHQRPSIHLPFSPLRSAAAGVGHNLLQKDPGGVSRSIFPFVTDGHSALPSLGVAGVLLGESIPAGQVRAHDSVLEIGDVDVPLQDDGRLLLRWRSGIPVHSFFDVLLSEEQARGGQAPSVPPTAFAGKIVFVGTSAEGLADVHATALGGTPGVHLHATAADNILSKQFMRRSPRPIDIALSLIAGVLAGATVAALPIAWALGSIAVIVAATSVAGDAAVGRGLWLPAAGPVVAVTLATAAGFAWQYFVEGREKREVMRLFGRFVSPGIFRQLMTNPSLARIGGERRQMSVLFSDIRGFTAASEQAAPEAVVAQLNEYFSAMVDVLFRHQGTLDKFVGDQVMGLFGAPVDDERHADHAVAAALDMSHELDRLNAKWEREHRPRLEIGIGINSGEMIAGNIGSESLMSYTVIGDAVNLGARIEALNKDLGTRILISARTFQLLIAAPATRRIGEVTVKGRRESVTVYEVIL